jgi:hypothetical protein
MAAACDIFRHRWSKLAFDQALGMIHLPAVNLICAAKQRFVAMSGGSLQRDLRRDATRALRWDD